MLFIGGLLVSGCASNKFKKGSVKSIKTAAVVSVYCDRRINTSEFEGDAAAMSELAQNESFQLGKIATRMKDDAFNEYAPHLPFTLLEEQSVIDNSSYQNLYNGQKLNFKPYQFTAPDRYQIIFSANKKIIDELFEAFPEAEGLMFIVADFKLEKAVKIAGMGTAKVKANHTIYVIDRNKKIVMQKHNYASSKKSIKFAWGGVFNASKIQPLCEESLNEAAEMTKKWVQKKV